MAEGLQIDAGNKPNSKALQQADPQVLQVLKQMGLDQSLIDDIEQQTNAVLGDQAAMIGAADGTSIIASNAQVQKQSTQKRESEAAASARLAESVRGKVTPRLDLSIKKKQTGNLFSLVRKQQ